MSSIAKEDRNCKIRGCLLKTQPFFAEGTVRPDQQDSNAFFIDANMLLPENRSLRVRVVLRATFNDQGFTGTFESPKAATPTSTTPMNEDERPRNTSPSDQSNDDTNFQSAQETVPLPPDEEQQFQSFADEEVELPPYELSPQNFEPLLYELVELPPNEKHQILVTQDEILDKDVVPSPVEESQSPLLPSLPRENAELPLSAQEKPLEPDAGIQETRAGSSNLVQIAPQTVATAQKMTNTVATIVIFTERDSGSPQATVRPQDHDEYPTPIFSNVRRRLQFTTSPASSSRSGQISEQSSSTGDRSFSVQSLLSLAEDFSEAAGLSEPYEVLDAILSDPDEQLVDMEKRLRRAIKSGHVNVDRPRRPARKAPKKRQTMAEKADLVFPPLRIGRQLSECGLTDCRWRNSSKVALAAVLESVTIDLLDISAEEAKKRNRTRITPIDIRIAVAEDDEFRRVFRNVDMAVDPPIKNFIK